MSKGISQALVIGGIGFALWYAWKYLVLGAGLQFIPLSVSTGGNGLVVNLGVQNPTSSPVVLSSFAGSLYVNGSPIANVSNFQGLTVAANQQTMLAFNVVPNWIGLGSDVVNIIQNGFQGLNTTLKGVANINGNAIPVMVNF